ncbi:MAG: hypothetical protein ACR2JE_13825 [Acidobacteriaceae bacterium]
MALPPASIAFATPASGRGTKLPRGGFPEMLEALTSERLAQLKQPAQGAEQKIPQAQAMSNNAQVPVPGAEEGLIADAAFAGEDADLPGRLVVGGGPQILTGQRSSGVLLPLTGDATAVVAGEIGSESSRTPRKEANRDGSIEKEKQTGAVPLATHSITANQPSVAIAAVLPVPTLIVAPPPAEPQTHPVNQKPGRLAGIMIGLPRLAGSAAIARGNATGQDLQVNRTLNSATPIAGQADAGLQSPRRDIPLPPLNAPHPKEPIEAPVELGGQPEVHLPGRSMQTSSNALSREGAAPAKLTAPLVTGAPATKPGEPTHGAIGIVTDIETKAMVGQPVPLHSSPAGPGHGTGSTGAEIGGNIHNTLQPSGGGLPLAERNPFQRLDSLSTDPSLHLRSRSNTIEAGIESPSYGWIEVKATFSAGLVSASIHATDAGVTPVIQSHLQGLSSFLSEQAIPMREVTIGAGLAGGNGEGRDGHSGENEQGQAGPGTTRAPTPRAPTISPDVTSSSVISLHA